MTTLPALILIALILVPVLGLALFILGWRGRRVDDLPFCRKCRFSLAGLDTASADAKCPECGRSLAGPRAVGVGRRKRRKSLLIAGGFLLLAALAGGGVLGWGAATSFNWNTVKPVWWLEMDTGSTSGPTVAAAYGELTSRLNAGTLPDEEAKRFVQRALAYQRTYARPWSVEIGDFIEAARLKQLVSLEDWVLYHRQGISLSGRLRTQIRHGAPLPFELGATGSRLGSGGGLWVAVERHAVKLDRPGLLDETTGGARMRPSFGGRTWTSGTFDVDLPVGRHGLIQSADVALLQDGSDEPLDRWTVQYESFVTVVDDATTSVPGQGSETLNAAVRSAISVEHLRIGSADEAGVAWVAGTIRASNLPVDCAFRVFAVVNGQEVAVARQSFEATTGQHASTMSMHLPGFTADTLTLILRTDHETAERTVDIVELWDGEIVLENLPVARERQGQGAEPGPP